MESTDQGRSLKKFCSLLTYIEHRNRELYDAIHDLCLTGAFNTRRGRSITFLMPHPKSSFHTKIINSAYGADPDLAANLIRACLLTVHIKTIDEFAKVDGGKLPNELKQELEVEKAGKSEVVLKNGNATIIADGSFAPLYETSRFGVFVIKSGELSTDNSSAPDRNSTPRSKKKKMDDFDNDDFPISGGMEAKMQSYVNANKMNKHALVQTMLNSWKQQLTVKTAMPDWLASDAQNVFTKAAVSFYTFISGRTDSQKYFDLLDENPVCICAILCIFVDGDIYDQWVNATDASTINYSYSTYLGFVAKRTRPVYNVTECLDASIKLINAKNLKGFAEQFLAAYKVMYPDGDMAKKMLVYHEALFILFDMLRSINAKHKSKIEAYINIYNTHYCSAKTPMLTNPTGDAGFNDMAIACKAFEFMQSTYFAPQPPGKETKQPTQLDSWKEPGVKLNNSRYDGTQLVIKYFS